MDRDLIIVGGGPVGASLALAARGLSVALLAQEPSRSTLQRRLATGAGTFDSRVYALSPGNVEFLRRIKIWDRLAPERLAPVHTMRIFGDDARSMIEFDAYRAGVPQLAWIVEDAQLQDALSRAVDNDLLLGKCESISFDEKHAVLALQDARRLTAKLVVGADGANSVVRREAGIAAAEKDYGQAAVVANFRCARPHEDTAWQWFQGGPVLALLPLPGNEVSMVWSLPAAEAERIARLEPEALCGELELASHGVLGAFVLTGAARSYPLRRLSARRLVGPRVALVGDAGHVIHPLAGQGLNLGLQDARALTAVLAEREAVRDPGDLRLLRRYERSRAEPILAMDTVVDGLFNLFRAQGSLSSRLRNAGLNLSNRLPVLKNILVRAALKTALIAVIFSLTIPAEADDAKIRRVIEDKLGGVKVEGIQPGPLGLYEVRFRSSDGVRVVYTDANATHIFLGKIYETKTDRDLTDERLRKLNAIRFDALPLAQAVKIQRGSGKRVLAMFSDPYCPACKQFEQTLQQLDDITVYVFMFPVIRPELADHSKAVWCSPDPAKAWIDLAMRGKRPGANAACANPVEKNLELGRSLGVNATPTLIFANGERVAGGLREADLKELLDQTAAAKPR